MARHKDFDWSLNEGTVHPDGHKTFSIDTIKTSILLDIRDELKMLNHLLHCSNFTRFPATLRTIARNTAKKRRSAAQRKKGARA